MEGAYNSEMYKRKCKGKMQEDYCTPVYEAWCEDKHDHLEHQKASATAANLGGKAQSSAKPSQW